MQNKISSRSKLQHYLSVKNHQHDKEDSNKNMMNHTKSINKKSKIKIQKSNSKSQIKNKKIVNNENYNSINLYGNETSRPTTNIFENQINKKSQVGCKMKRHSNQRMGKSKSTGKMNIRIQRKTISPSPLVKQQQFIHEDKIKTAKNSTCRLQKQKKQVNDNKIKVDVAKLKKSTSKITVISKDQCINKSNNPDKVNLNRVSVKTSSNLKTHSTIRQQKKKTKLKVKEKNDINKNKKQKSIKMNKYNQQKNKFQSIVQKSKIYSDVSFQDCNGSFPYQSAIMSNQRYFLPYPQTKSIKTQGCQIQIKGEYKSNFKDDRNQAALKIQKVFRGFITRKYIDQAKYIISKVKIIQHWWRKIISKTKYKHEIINKKIHNSYKSNLNTQTKNENLIKTQKAEKMISQQHQILLKSSKQIGKDLICNVLKQNDGQLMNRSHHMNSPLNQTPSQSSFYNKQQYIDFKIKDQILSQRKFNSPRNNSPCSFINTPTNNVCFNIKEYFNSNMINSNEKGKIKQIMQSPKLVSPLKKSQSKKIISPLSNKNQNHQPQQIIKEEVNDIYKPFETNFVAIQQICLCLVDYFKVKEQQMQSFIKRLQEIKLFKTNLVLKNWNSYKLYSQQNIDFSQSFPSPDYQYLQNYQKPTLFPQELRDDIIKFPQIYIQLNNKNYNLHSKMSGQLNKYFLNFIFDALQYAFYQPYRYNVLKYGESLDKNIYKSNKDIFQRYLCCALGNLFSWGQVLCGIMSDFYSDQQKIRQQRMIIFEKRLDHWDLGISSQIGIKLQITFLIIEELIEQIYQQMFNF